ncbi:hypothetical protein BDW22DRAFT_1353441 [Trametopsis cervina]|nr:hypothetical protein BDW22DRAFT_1353441 [Trametopsis cervina]
MDVGFGRQDLEDLMARERAIDLPRAYFANFLIKTVMSDMPNIRCSLPLSQARCDENIARNRETETMSRSCDGSRT